MPLDGLSQYLCLNFKREQVNETRTKQALIHSSPNLSRLYPNAIHTLIFPSKISAISPLLLLQGKTSTHTSTFKMSESAFFASFPDFAHNPAAPISEEFSRLAAQRCWKKGSKTWKKSWSRCMNDEYDRLVGKSLTGLEGWVQLCSELGIDGEFTSIRQCKMVCAVSICPED